MRGHVLRALGSLEEKADIDGPYKRPGLGREGKETLAYGRRLQHSCARKLGARNAHCLVWSQDAPAAFREVRLGAVRHRSSSHATWETASEPAGRADRPEPNDHGRARQNGSQREHGHSAVAGCHDVASLPRRAPCPETSSAGWSQCGAPDPATKVGERSDQTNRVAPCMLPTSPTRGQHLWRR
jgi:hypothetical protein